MAIEDPSLPLKSHQEKIEKLSQQVKGHASISPFVFIKLMPNCAILARQYVKYSLYDRLSTRPFLTHFEKKWITFQCLACFDWCHNRNICHGDLKLENILVTSNLWVVITDFATYKPVLLPDVSFVIFVSKKDLIVILQCV